MREQEVLEENSTSCEYIGVAKRGDKYVALITHRGKTRYLAHFLDPRKAALRFDQESWRLRKDKNRLNFPDELPKKVSKKAVSKKKGAKKKNAGKKKKHGTKKKRAGKKKKKTSSSSSAKKKKIKESEIPPPAEEKCPEEMDTEESSHEALDEFFPETEESSAPAEIMIEPANADSQHQDEELEEVLHETEAEIASAEILMEPANADSQDQNKDSSAQPEETTRFALLDLDEKEIDAAETFKIAVEFCCGEDISDNLAVFVVLVSNILAINAMECLVEDSLRREFLQKMRQCFSIFITGATQLEARNRLLQESYDDDPLIEEMKLSWDDFRQLHGEVITKSKKKAVPKNTGKKSKKPKKTKDSGGLSDAQRKAKEARHTNDNSYFYRFNLEGEAIRRGSWDAEETEKFYKRLKEFGANFEWGTFSEVIPGRCGYNCSSFWRKQITQGIVQSWFYIGSGIGKRGSSRKNVTSHWKRYSFIILKDAHGVFPKTPWCHPKAPDAIKKKVATLDKQRQTFLKKKFGKKEKET